MQRLRIRYAKRGRLRFASHRDFSRAFERALVRARLPMAYSSGFNPHPRISYAGAAPTGAASEAEYVEIGLAEVIEPSLAHDRLSTALPPGLDVVAVVESPGGALAERLQASLWRLLVPVPPGELADAVAALLAADEVLVERMTKRGLREFDARSAVVSLTVVAVPGEDADQDEESSELALVLRHQEPAVRADDVLTALIRVGQLDRLPAALVTRVAQGPLAEDGSVGDPFEVS